LKVAADGKVTRVMRAEAPWSPSGVAATKDGRVFVLEVGFTSPNIYSGPRVRELLPDGTLKVLATVGQKETAVAPTSSGRDASAQAGVKDKDNTERVARALRLYFGLGLVAILAVAGLKGFARRTRHA
jgi:hypothetical protein